MAGSYEGPVSVGGGRESEIMRTGLRAQIGALGIEGLYTRIFYFSKGNTL